MNKLQRVLYRFFPSRQSEDYALGLHTSFVAVRERYEALTYAKARYPHPYPPIGIAILGQLRRYEEEMVRLQQELHDLGKPAPRIDLVEIVEQVNKEIADIAACEERGRQRRTLRAVSGGK